MSIPCITRKSLLYRSKVEYGGWTANHVLGCAHGCRYPCYAMMLAKRTGRVSDYDDWLRPRVVSNALDLIDAELAKSARDIDSVHLCFTTDPFMYDSVAEEPIQEIASMTSAIIRRLNNEGIPVTTLTKGVYPDDFIDAVSDLHPDNQYGISLVSLSDSYREQWEPGSAPASKRVASLRRLSTSGARIWISAEPYPTPNIDETASAVTTLLEAVDFADKIVFGRWNYNSMVTAYDRETDFYADIASQVISWCSERRLPLHIKKGTPLSNSSGKDILRRLLKKSGANPRIQQTRFARS